MLNIFPLLVFLVVALLESDTSVNPCHGGGSRHARGTWSEIVCAGNALPKNRF